MNGRTFLALGSALLLATASARAQEAPPAGEGKASEAPAPAAKGLVVFVDPATGKIRQPEPAEIAALTALRAGTAGAIGLEPPLEMKTGAGGAVGIVLDSRYDTFLVVTKAPDGRLATSCVTGGRNAAQAVASGATPVPTSAATPAGKEARRAP